MFCNSCGKSNASDAVFCVSCGNRVSQSADTTITVEGTTLSPKKPAGFNLNDKKTKLGLVAAAGVLILGTMIVLSSGGSAIPAALKACNLTTSTSGVALDDDGKNVFFDGSGEEDFSGIPYSDVSCVLKELDAPESIFERIGTTTSLKGLVEGEWGNYSANWTYHPDNGLDLSLQLK